MNDGWQRYAAPAAFLLAVTIAVVLVRAGLESGGGNNGPATTTASTVTRRGTTTTTAATTTTRRPPAKRYYTVQVGDTFSVISRKTGVPVATIQRLNPNVASTSLHIGQQVRIR